jgi:bacillithiol biosynthesis deacetylase BshB1
MSIDVLAIGAHPDDADIGIGGTLIALARQGYTTAILDLSRGELASRGTTEEREVEAQNAAKVLRVSERLNAKLPDGNIANSAEQRKVLIPILRRLRPSVILSHRDYDRHPDHNGASALVHDANFFAGVASIQTAEEPWRANQLIEYTPYKDDDTPPKMVFDISDSFETKMEALNCYESQLHNQSYEGSKTYVSSPEFWDFIKIRASYWGHRIGVQYGEPLYMKHTIKTSTLPGLEPKS